MQLDWHLPYILLDEGEHSVALKAFETYHLHPDIRYKVTDDYSILTMVQKEMGYSILFRLTLAGYAKDVAVVPITEPFERTIALAWRNYDALSYGGEDLYFVYQETGSNDSAAAGALICQSPNTEKPGHKAPEKECRIRN